MTSSRPPRRPATFGPAAMDAQLALGADPAVRVEAAHATAAALVGHVRAEPEDAARLVRLTDDHGLDVVAELWADRPADSLPGALWRLYALRAWVRADPSGTARSYDRGRWRAGVDEVLAGVAEPPGPQEVSDLADAVLTGAFRGDLADALDRAAAFCRVVATGWALDADASATHEQGHTTTRRASDLRRTADQLHAAAERWRLGELS